MDSEKIKIGITQGDLNGIGLELVLKTFSNAGMLDLCTPVLYASAKAATYHRKAISSETNFHIVKSATEAQSGMLNLVNCFDDEVKIEFGKPSVDSGRAALAALEKAVEEYKSGMIDAIVTAPISKSDIQGPSFQFKGHTEFFADRVGDGMQPLMILMNNQMKVALLSTHVAVKDISSQLTREALMEKLRIFHKSLRIDFRISIPRIAVLALNPHAGDDGLLGSEEKEIIIPVISELEKESIFCFGPFAADGFFGAGLYREFDGVMAMYHDQGLAPFKALSMNDGVNFTAGLPLVRTSPDHGTAYDIAGKGVANENSFRHAIYTAIDVLRNRRLEAEMFNHRLVMPLEGEKEKK